jgi:hypothetical protein
MWAEYADKNNGACIIISERRFLEENQVILKNGFPFNVELPKVNETELESLAKIIESTGGNGVVNEKNQKIIHLYSLGEIDYETAVFAIKRSFM